VEPSFRIDMAQPVKAASPFLSTGFDARRHRPDKFPLLHHWQPIPLKGNGLLGLSKIDGLQWRQHFQLQRSFRLNHIGGEFRRPETKFG
jgi:hypothetical protein